MIDVCVTGSAGYLGSVLWDFFPFSTRFAGDVRDEAALVKELAGIRTVVHLAALRDKECAESPEEARSVNVQGTRTVVEAAEKAGVHTIVFASSCSAYGWREGLLRESARLEPTSVYGQTKKAGEEIVLSSRIPVKVVLRFATLCGPSPNMRYDTLLNQLVHQAKAEGEVKIFEPYAWRPLLHVRDAARVIMRSFSLPITAIVNVGYGNYRKLTIGEMVKDCQPSVKLTIDTDVRDKRSYLIDFRRMNDLFGCAYVSPPVAVKEMWR